MDAKSVKEEAYRLCDNSQYNEAYELFFSYLEETKDNDLGILNKLDGMLRGLTNTMKQWLIKNQDNSYALVFIGRQCSGNIEIEYYRRSAEKGNLLGMYHLGSSCMNQQQYETGFNLLLQSEDYYKSQLFLGYIYRTHAYCNALNIDMDYIKALEYYYKALEIVYSYDIGNRIVAIQSRVSLQTKEEFDSINNVLDHFYTFPVTVEKQIEMIEKHYRKRSFDIIYTFFTEHHYIPKVLVDLIVNYI